MSLQCGNGVGDLVGGDDNGNGDRTVMKENVDGMNCLWKDILRVVEWIIKESGDTVKGDDNASSSMASKLKKQFMASNARITELEDQLEESQEENDVLKEKLNAMELLAGHQQCELIRLNSEVEREKWERFDAENRLKNMVKEVTELQATLAELVAKIREQERENSALAAITDGTVVIKQEVPDDDQLLERSQIGEEVEDGREELHCMFAELTGNVQQKLQKYEGMQLETRTELASIREGLSNLERIISGSKTGRTPTVSSTASSLSSSKSSTVSVITRYEIPRDVNGTQAPSTVMERSTIIPVPIKSILMKRSADGTFMIRRDSQDHHQHQDNQQNSTTKRKRVQFCLEESDVVTVHTDHKENHRQNPLEASDKLPDPLEIDDEEFHQLPNEGEHHEIYKEGDTINRFYCKCGRSFLRKKLLNRHLSAKLNGKIFSCPTCFKTFVLHESLKKHVQKSHKHQYQGGRYGCRQCGQTFGLYRQLRQHRSIHQGRKKF